MASKTPYDEDVEGPSSHMRVRETQKVIRAELTTRVGTVLQHEAGILTADVRGKINGAIVDALCGYLRDMYGDV